MKNFIFTGKLNGETITLKQVQKRTALKMYNNGSTIYLQSSNFHPFGYWSNVVHINKENQNCNGESFDKIVNSFEYYNCQNKETGLYTTFYIKIN